MARSNPDDVRGFLPLSAQVFQILLSLAEAPRHGYAIIVDVRERTGGEIALTASTLYDALARLLDQQLIRETAAPAPRGTGASSDARRRYYELTTLGRDVAQAEARRLERLVAMARARKLLARR
jgi:DNA-binding PadR family transcriptional regulator